MTIVTLREAAERIGVSAKTIYRMIEAGRFPGAYKTGEADNSHWRIPVEDLEAVIQELREKSSKGGGP